MNSRHILALVLVAGLAVGIGANPRFIEQLKIGGGYDDSVDGGADFERDGDIFTSGTIVAGDAAVAAIDHAGNSFTPRLQVITEGDSSSADQVAIGRNVDVAGDDPEIWLYRSRGTNGSESIVQSGDSIGSFMFLGHDGTDYEIAAYIRANVDATPGADDMPGSLAFLVTPDGSSAPAVAVTITNDKTVTFQGDISLGAQLMQDGLLQDSGVLLADNGDTTKRVAFEASGIATGTTRTVTLADQDIDLTPTTGSFQASDTDLTALAAVSGAKGELLVHNGSAWIDLAPGSDGQQLEADSTTRTGLKWASAGGAGSHPVSDTNSIVEGSADATKELRFELDTHLSSASTRLWHVADRDIDFATDVGFVDTAQEWSAAQNFKATTLTDGANIEWDLSANQVASVTLGGNRTLDNPTDLNDGGTYIVIVRQDATGGRTLTFGTAYKWPGGTAPTLSTGANDIDILTFVSDGTNMYGVAVQDFS